MFSVYVTLYKLHSCLVAKIKIGWVLPITNCSDVKYLDLFLLTYVLYCLSFSAIMVDVHDDVNFDDLAAQYLAMFPVGKIKLTGVL